MSAAQRLLDRLEKVRTVAPQRWMAKCPAHDEKTGSLSIRETDDGRVLLHCFGGGCPAGDIVAAVGLSLGDLFDKPLAHQLKGQEGKHWHAAKEALRSIQFDCIYLVIVSESLAAGIALPPEDRATLAGTVARITAAARMVV